MPRPFQPTNRPTATAMPLFLSFPKLVAAVALFASLTAASMPSFVAVGFAHDQISVRRPSGHRAELVDVLVL